MGFEGNNIGRARAKERTSQGAKERENARRTQSELAKRTHNKRGRRSSRPASELTVGSQRRRRRRTGSRASERSLLAVARIDVVPIFCRTRTLCLHSTVGRARTHIHSLCGRSAATAASSARCSSRARPAARQTPAGRLALARLDQAAAGCHHQRPANGRSRAHKLHPPVRQRPRLCFCPAATLPPPSRHAHPACVRTCARGHLKIDAADITRCRLPAACASPASPSSSRTSSRTLIRPVCAPPPLPPQLTCPTQRVKRCQVDDSTNIASSSSSSSSCPPLYWSSEALEETARAARTTKRSAS